MIKIVAGNTHPELAQNIADRLNTALARVLVVQLANGETTVTVGESLREAMVFVVQTGCGIANPHGRDAQADGTQLLNDALMELLLLIHACRMNGARKIVAVLPLYPYARQDKKDRARAPITAKLVANLIMAAGAHHLVTMDLHAGQIQGFFDIPVDNLRMEAGWAEHIQSGRDGRRELVIVSPDAGGARRATSLAARLGLPFAIMHKERAGAGQVASMTLVGNVAGKDAIIVDDMADTCGTLCHAAAVLMEHGAVVVDAMVVHAVLSGNAREQIETSPLRSLTVSNTVPVDERGKIRVLSTAGLFSEAIRRIYNGESVSHLFQ